ncbi:MAG: vitamin K epoxide reductase family protein [Chloroflexi bacterium]|nr:MAG: vitamin K epoxide reductase family protein [Chloroflexota bacterium]
MNKSAVETAPRGLALPVGGMVVYVLLIILSIAGIGVSAYLLWGYTTPGATLACGGSHGCETVKNSAYASLFGIPMPVYGLVIYLGLLALLIAQNHPASVERNLSPYIGLAIFGASLVGVLFSAYLTYLELYVILAICYWCVASAVIMSGIFVGSMFNLRYVNQYFSFEG